MKRRKVTTELSTAIERINSFVTDDGCSNPATDAQRAYFCAWVLPPLTRALTELVEGA